VDVAKQGTKQGVPFDEPKKQWEEQQ